MNPVAERANRTLVETAKSMLEEANLSKEWWAEAIATATYLKNRFPIARLGGKSPYEAWTGQQPDLTKLKAFGTKVKVHIPKADRKKLDPNAKDRIFVGYGCIASLYRVAIRKRVSEYRDIRWNEMPKKETKTRLELEDSDLV